MEILKDKGGNTVGVIYSKRKATIVCRCQFTKTRCKKCSEIMTKEDILTKDLEAAVAIGLKRAKRIKELEDENADLKACIICRGMCDDVNDECVLTSTN